MRANDFSLHFVDYYNGNQYISTSRFWICQLLNEKGGENLEIVTKVVGIAIGVFVLALTMPTALGTLANASKTTGVMQNVDSSVRTLLVVLVPVLAVIGIALIFLRSHE